MRRLCKHYARLCNRQSGKKLQKQRDEIRQLAARYIQPSLLIALQQRDHRLSPIAGLSVHMLKKMQGKRFGTVEQLDIPALRIQQVVLRDIPDQGTDLATMRCCQQVLDIERRNELSRSMLELAGGIRQSGAQNLVGCDHHQRPAGSGSLCLAGTLKRLALLLPSEQPLPKVKPQLPRRSSASSVLSR